MLVVLIAGVVSLRLSLVTHSQGIQLIPEISDTRISLLWRLKFFENCNYGLHERFTSFKDLQLRELCLIPHQPSFQLVVEELQILQLHDRGHFCFHCGKS